MICNSEFSRSSRKPFKSSGPCRCRRQPVTVTTAHTSWRISVEGHQRPRRRLRLRLWSHLLRSRRASLQLRSGAEWLGCAPTLVGCRARAQQTHGSVPAATADAQRFLFSLAGSAAFECNMQNRNEENRRYSDQVYLRYMSNGFFCLHVLGSEVFDAFRTKASKACERFATQGAESSFFEALLSVQSKHYEIFSMSLLNHVLRPRGC